MVYQPKQKPNHHRRRGQDQQSYNNQAHARCASLSSTRPARPPVERILGMPVVFQNIGRVKRASLRCGTQNTKLPLTLAFFIGPFRGLGDQALQIFHLPTQVGFLLREFSLFV
jgi:hypothetical protein